MKKRSAPPAALGGILHQALQGLGTPARCSGMRLPALWKQAVGDYIATHSCPVGLRAGVLTVHVSNPAWMQELHFLRAQLLEALNLLIPEEPLRDITFRIGPVAGEPRPEEPAPPTPLTPAEVERVRDSAAAIADPDLRSTFSGLMKAYLKNRSAH